MLKKKCPKFYFRNYKKSFFKIPEFYFISNELIRFSENPPHSSCDYFSGNEHNQRYLKSILNSLMTLGEHYSGGENQFKSFLNEK